MSEIGAPPGADPRRWQVLVATARGAAHESAGRPLQDAAATVGDLWRDGEALVVAVADGHGHPRHARSGTGAALAVEVAAAVTSGHGRLLSSAVSAPRACAAARDGVVPGVIAAWHRAVAGHVAEHPLGLEETRWLRPGEDAAVAYGTTLLLAALAPPWLVLCQIGDGDIVVVDSAGTAQAPVPGDDRLDGWRTTSLCQPDALESFRCAALHLDGEQVAAVLLATDGFGNAQGAKPWHQPVGADLLSFTRRHGIEWMRGQLPGWAARCASADGSSDDTAIALVLRDDPLPAATAPADQAGVPAHQTGVDRA